MSPSGRDEVLERTCQPGTGIPTHESKDGSMQENGVGPAAGDVGGTRCHGGGGGGGDGVSNGGSGDYGSIGGGRDNGGTSGHEE